ncbi:methionyl-tRNA formyltransferase [Chromobacterium piscinae]|uniref:Methionyl-tRNA formyltransferase n=1 Tax=Chromobacterium piscinae TaxID=686831 RepID=A0ABV0H6B6_9NEIS|nr:methionyl-tRNA formyltransferase [Chromobacterium piscinae]MBX9297040.1 methionyl-tRNA formyltransferase [Chromobacterium vaccinii]MBX9359329.1 methionyl-tRNA formyltransferase [Chromobacterium vaccinii]MCD4504643.1 methionyl-tRNA formyltransferase [Chromobacterium piscinae]MCD5328130.1 methionyl-tRNA formyltransferase [Chromobacterium piscinae]
MKLIFAGTPEFAAAALRALIDAGHEIALVLTQPDRPAGRGMKLKPSPVKEVALAHGLRVEQPEKLRGNLEAQQMLRDVGAEVMVVAAYGLILPQDVLEIPARGCLNIHASLLPRWRGAAPIQRAILAGDAETGITIMQMDVGLDTGDMLSIHPLAIAADETAATLHDKLAACGAQAIVETLGRLDAILPQKQPEDGVTYAQKLSKAEAEVDWTLSAEDVARAIRAYNPAPGAFTQFGGEPLKLWLASAEAGSAEPGAVVSADADGVLVGAGQGLVRLTVLQAAGGKRLAARDFVAGKSLPAGTRLGV